MLWDGMVYTLGAGVTTTLKIILWPVLTQESTMAKMKNIYFGLLVNVVEFIIRLQ